MADEQPLPISKTESNIQSQRPPFLRRCSVSDPRLDILPHDFGQEKAGFNPFNRVLSGLLEGSAFSLNKMGASTESVDKEGGGHHGHNLQPHNTPRQEHFGGIIQPKTGSSAAEIKNTTTPAAGGLRKSATSISALFGSSPQQHFPTIPENEDQGLMMSARPSALANGGLNQTNATPKNAGEAAVSPQKSGGLMRIFGGGFLSKPVLHSPEENYRYLMALDR